ncbi:MAG: hypothetical protein AAF957_10215 [Planctomycetota bacterium]
MKRSIIDPLAASLLLLAPLSAPAAAQQNREPDPVTVDAPEDISASLHRLDDLIALGMDIEPELVVLKRVILDRPSNAQLRARMMRYIDELNERARRVWVDHLDAALLRQQFAEARVDHAIDVLEDRARAGGWSADEFRDVMAGWIARGRDYVDAPDPESFRLRLVGALERAHAGAKHAADVLSVLRGDLLDRQAEDALEMLRARIADGSVSDADFARLYELIAQRRALAEGSVEDADEPQDPNAPKDAGPPSDAGGPKVLGPPIHVGGPRDAGPPSDAGAPKDLGPPVDVGGPKDAVRPVLL